VTERLDPYGTWGDWDLQQFKVEVARWRATHPPHNVVARVAEWWPSLTQPGQRTGAVQVSRENDPEGNLWWMWVPRAAWLDDEAGYFRVQCFFRIYRVPQAPRLVCDEFRTVRSMAPAEVDRAEDMG
jgi:hypothetical protein